MGAKFLVSVLLVCIWASAIGSYFAYIQDAEPFHHSTADEIQCHEITDCTECVKSNLARVVMGLASPIKDVCQWCRHTGTCFNSTETGAPTLLEPAPSKPPKPATCSYRCSVKSLDMCPPSTLLCGSLMNCMNCTNHSFCDFCDSTQQCFNPCGDDMKSPITPESAPLAPQTSEEPSETPSYTPEDSLKSPDLEPTTDMSLDFNQKRGFFIDEPYRCQSCVWNSQGQCKTAEFCASMHSCGACTANPSCGWCGNNIEGKCLVAGANQKPCAGASCKYWSYGNCEVACNSHSDCNSCIEDQEAQCSWCAGGTLHGRKSSYCGTSKIAHQCEATFKTQCPECSRSESCSQCLKKPNCGWCAQKIETLSNCVEGIPAGPFDPSDCVTNEGPSFGWIQACQPWNATSPVPPHSPPHHVTPPAKPPVAPAPVHPAPVHEPPVHPPTTPPVIPEPVSSPVEISPAPNVPESPEPTNPKPHSIPSQHIPPRDSPAKLIEPYVKEIGKMYNLGFIIGGSVSGAIVIIGGILWFKLHANATHRYRAIG